MKKLLSLVMFALLAVGANAQTISWNAEASAGSLASTYGSDGFILTRTDTGNKHAIDNNTAKFGNATENVSFSYRLKVGAKSSNSNGLKLTIPYAGTLKVYVRSSNGSAETRTLVLTQNSVQIYEGIIKDADKSSDGYFPIVSVPVEEGTVDITYPVDALNFYGFELVESSEPVAPQVEAPTAIVGSYNYEKEGYAVTITSKTEGATVSYKVGSGSYTNVENGSTVYVKDGELTIKASKDDYRDSGEVTVGTLNVAPSSTSPETLIAFVTSKDDYDKDQDHDYVSVGIPGTYVAGRDGGNILKIRTNRKGSAVEGITNDFCLKVKEGYKITKVKMTVRANYDGIITVPSMYVDGVAVDGFESFEIPKSSNASYLTKEFESLNAISEIAWELVPGTYGDKDETVTQFKATIEVTYAPTSETKEVTEHGWATYIPAYPAKFNEGDAYVVTNVNTTTGVVTIENVTEVPANTAVLLKGEGEKTITYIESANALTTTNMLEVYTSEQAGKFAYVLAKDGDSAGFKKWTGEASVLTGRAVLWLDNEIATARGFFALDSETTGIESVAPAATQDGAVYDLQGRRVAQPKSGLYIVNGKKVVVK